MKDEDYGRAIHDDMAALRADLNKLVESLKGAASAQGEAAYGQFRTATERTKTQAKETMASTAQVIEERPLTSVLVAFGVGLLLGILFDRRS